jgi:hypothetical protein
MIELTEVQESYLSEYIDREFLCRASSLFDVLIHASEVEASDSSTAWSDRSRNFQYLSELNEELGHLMSIPQLGPFVERHVSLEDLNLELEHLEDSTEADTEETTEAIDDLQGQIDSLRDDEEFYDNNPAGAIHNVWIITKHAAECPYWESIMEAYPGSKVPIIEVADVYFWVNMEYDLAQCDWLRTLVSEHIRTGS